MSDLVLVVIDLSDENPCYTRFEGRVQTHRLRYITPLSAYWVEEMRRDPEQFKVQEAEQ